MINYLAFSLAVSLVIMFIVNYRVIKDNQDMKTHIRYVDNRLQEHLVAYNKRVRYQDSPELEAEDKRLAEFQHKMMMGASEKDMLWSKNPELLRNSDTAKKYNEMVKNL